MKERLVNLKSTAVLVCSLSHTQMPGMPEYLVPKGGDQEATHRLKKFMVRLGPVLVNSFGWKGCADLYRTHCAFVYFA